MNTPEQPVEVRRPFISREAIIGIGVTIAEIGILFLLLGWAEMLRAQHGIGASWLIAGAVLLLVGAIAAADAWSKKESH